MKYTESQLEESFVHRLKEEKYKYVNDKNVVRTSNQEVLIREDLSEFSLSRDPDLDAVNWKALSMNCRINLLPVSTIAINTLGNSWQTV